MSIAVLPPPHITMSLPMCSPAKRPKLSLDTTTSSTVIGRKTTSLRLETLSAISPTVRNTFGNAFDQVTQPEVELARKRYPATPRRLIAEDSPTSASVSPTSPMGNIPYDVSFHINSILRNGPRSRNLHRISKPKPLSPDKRVVFRAPLTEEVKNKKCIYAHYDMEPVTPTIATLDLSSVIPEIDDGQLLQPKTYSAVSNKAEGCATPIAGRGKKDRTWQWTLGPVDSVDAV